MKSTVSPGSVRIKGEHLLQVLKHVIKESVTKASLLKPPSLPVHGISMSLEVTIKVSLLVGLIVGVGVKVVLVSLLLTKRVRVSENVIKVEVERLEVLLEVIVPTASSSSSMSLP